MFSKIQKVLRNQYFILALITLLALFVRLLNIDKSYGLWVDEMFSYYITSKGFPFEIISSIFKIDYHHMPLHYYYLGVWMHFFGNNDVVLRLSSVFWGVITVPAFFYLGKTYMSEKLGYFLAVVASLSPILIYYSQEVRLYSMLVFFSTLSLIFFLKTIDNPNKKNLLLLGFFNLGIIYTYTMGGLFVFIQWFILLLHLYLYKKDYLINYFIYSLIFFISSIPYIILLVLCVQADSQGLVKAFPWGGDYIFNPIPLFNDLLSPFFSNIVDGVGWGKYFYYFKFSGLKNFLLFSSIPTICFLLGLIRNLLNPNKKTLYLFCLFLFFFLIEVILNIVGGLNIMTRYALIILPIILLLGSGGILLIKNIYIKKLFIGLILIVFILNSINYKISDSHKMRYNGFKFSAEALKDFDSKNTYLLHYRYNSDFFKKYLKNVNAIDFNTFSALGFDRTKTSTLKIFSKDFISKKSTSKIAAFCANPNPTKELKAFIDSSVKTIPKEGHIIFIEGPFGEKPFYEVQHFSQKFLTNNLDKKLYNRIILESVINKLRHDIKILLDKNLSLEKTKVFYKKIGSTDPSEKGKWVFYVYRKK